jgi:hypothetical protein
MGEERGVVLKEDVLTYVDSHFKRNLGVVAASPERECIDPCRRHFPGLRYEVTVLLLKNVDHRRALPLMYEGRLNGRYTLANSFPGISTVGCLVH